MHSERQLLAAGAEKVALWPQELVAWLRPSGCETTESCACNTHDSAPQATAATPSPAAARAPQPEPIPELALAAGRLRRDQQLQRRGAQALAERRAASLAPAPGRAGAPDVELLRALRRIVGGGS